MKKFLLTLFLSLALLPAVFAATDEFEITDASDKTFGFAPGLRLSILGLEPTFAINMNNLEFEAACAFSSGLDGKQMGFAPSVSIAYNTNPFEKGNAAIFGLEYMFLTPSYTNLLNKSLEKESYNNDEIELDWPGIHSLSLFYKGTHNFNNVFGMLWRIKLPLLMLPAEKVDGEIQNLNITNWGGFFLCSLIGVCETSVGVRFVF